MDILIFEQYWIYHVWLIYFLNLNCNYSLNNSLLKVSGVNGMFGNLCTVLYASMYCGIWKTSCENLKINVYCQLWLNWDIPRLFSFANTVANFILNNKKYFHTIMERKKHYHYSKSV